MDWFKKENGYINRLELFRKTPEERNALNDEQKAVDKNKCASILKKTINRLVELGY